MTCQSVLDLITKGLSGWHWPITLIWTIALMLCCDNMALAQTPGLRFIGEQTTATGTIFEDTLIGGLSGISYDASQKHYWVISDDRSRSNPARFYTVTLDFDANTFRDVQFQAVTFLTTFEGDTFAPNSVDPESIRLLGENLIWSNEGQNSPLAVLEPFIWEMDVDGKPLRSFALPEAWKPVLEARGVRNNLSLESLAVSPDGKWLFSATESTLIQDGAVSTIISNGLSRLMKLDIATEQLLAEYVYPLDNPPLNTVSTIGLTDMLALSEHHLLVLERSYAAGLGFGAKLYFADLSQATDVSTVESLIGLDYQTISKTLIFDFATLDLGLDNLEGMTLGPSFENGNQALILVSDNNFRRTQVTQWLLFELLSP